MSGHSLIGKTIADDYKVLSFLGKGGMGSVFAAEQPSLNRRVAIKILPSLELSHEDWHRFECEIASMATLTHPNIVTIHHRGKYGEPPVLYYVMELLEGGSLRMYLDKFEKIPPALAIRLIRPIAEVLAYAHEHGCIHRDIKPDNLLFTANHRSLKIADFGIAKLREGKSVTKSQSMIGTILYAAPEQMQWFEGEGQNEVDERADQYSLGVVLYEMVSGRLPYQADNLMAMMKAFSRPPISLIQAAGHGIPKSLDWLISTMIAKSREKRFLDDESLLDAFTNVEMELTSSVSTRVFALKSDELSLQQPPMISHAFEVQKEKSIIQSMETHYNLPTLTWYKALWVRGKSHFDQVRPVMERHWHHHASNKKIAIIAAFCFIASLLLYAVFGGNKNNSSEINEIIEKTHSNIATKKNNTNRQSPDTITREQVKLSIFPMYSFPRPAGYPKLQILFISPDNKWFRPVKPYEDHIPPGVYKISVILPGYQCPKHGKTVEIRPGKLFHLTLNLNALPRKVSPNIINKTTGESIIPLKFELDGNSVWDKTFPPRRYHFYILFEHYETIDTTEELEPGEGSFPYKTILKPLQEKNFSLIAKAKKNDGSYYPVETYVDKRKINKAHFDYRRFGGTVEGKIWLPQSAKKIIFRTGYYYVVSTPDKLATLSIDNIDGDRLYHHLRNVKSGLSLRRELENLWLLHSAKLLQLPENTKKRLYLLLKNNTDSKDMEKIDNYFWKWRRALNEEEKKEYDFFLDVQQKAQKSLNRSTKIKLWQKFIDKFPKSIYCTRAKMYLKNSRE